MQKNQPINSVWIKVIAIFISFIALSSFSAYASQYDKWAVNNPQSTTVVNHTPMSSIYKFLNAADSKKGLIAYYRSQGQVLEYVTKYRKYLEAIPVTALNKDEQLAYWLNLYNVTVIEMLSNDLKLTKKIKKLRGEPGNPGKEWSKKRVKVEKVYLSLEEIEQNILMANWKEPLVLYGLMYGTKGSPVLGFDAFKGSKVHEQLAAIAGKFISNKRNVKIKKNKVKLTSLYIWNKEVLFDNNDAKLIAHLQKYAQGSASSKLKKVTIVDSSHKYNWSTNAQGKPRKSANFNSGSGGGGGGGYGGGS